MNGVTFITAAAWLERERVRQGGCDCPTCTAGDDQWCCRTCHDLARGDDQC